ncbi:ferric reductase-like transmembrane domain-containing protein [Lysobacter enzymogenes]|uniref:ferric reductase-like transmembrane domain-containing protein n=1 Tax=Lysobacter enzymogenes TaxID=69 RepID=UPI001AF9B20F|nr:ferric reductase-like transmembrane domain-containing protein [Lysobacter enzymogenes]QQQ03366.1 ferric reductase-like transmembrane domain-containing protein [Lysobacter enzymogenes]
MIRSRSTFSGWPLLGVIAIAVLAMTGLTIAAQAELVDGVHSAVRATARSSFALFLLAFTASAFAVLLPGTASAALLRERRYVGLGFAFSHLVHAVLIYAYGRLAPEFWPSRTGLANVPGTIGYAFLLAMTITSFKPVARRMSATAWKRLHTAGMWVLAAVFALSYFKRIPMNPAYALPFALLTAAIAIRALGKLAQANKRRQRSARAQPAALRSS